MERFRAFTRVELLVTILALALLGIASLPAITSNKDRSDRALCVNNLRQVGRAFNMWANDHGGELPAWVDVSDGGFRNSQSGQTILSLPGIGLFPAGFRHNAWFHFVWLHRELETPALLLCPSDYNRRRATNFLNQPGGLTHPTLQNQALSYFLGMHAVSEYPNSIMAGDRHIGSWRSSAQCVSGIFAAPVFAYPNPYAYWTNKIMHKSMGNLVFTDGRVAEVSTGELDSLVRVSRQFDEAAEHILSPGLP